MKLPILPDLLFPHSTITTQFGWDPFTYPGAPRIHPAIDRAGAGIVHAPIAAERSAWIDNDAEGCSVFRLFFPGGELRMLHFIRSALDSGALAAALSGAPLEAGTPIGPTGNHGLSISKSGGDGRHVHYSLVLEPGVYDDDLAAHGGPGWNSDHSAEFRAQYGRAFILEVAKRGIRWMNRLIIARADPYYDGKLRFYVNTEALFGM